MFEIVRSETVGGRRDLAKLCNRKGLMTAVEIGVDQGIFAADFLSVWNGERLWLVDNWRPYPEMPWTRDGDFAIASSVLAPHARRVRIIKAASVQVAQWFKTLPSLPKQIGFVYVDAAHNAVSARQDIEAWWPLVQPNGILSGDDYGPDLPGVMEAVKAFAEQNGLRVDLTTDYDRSPSWYIEKSPELPPCAEVNVGEE